MLANENKLQYPLGMRNQGLPQRQDKTLSIRLYSVELETIKDAAKKLKVTLAVFVRDSCIARAKRVDNGARP